MGFLSLCDMSLAITHCNCIHVFVGISVDYIGVLFVTLSSQISLAILASISVVKELSLKFIITNLDHQYLHLIKSKP